MFRNFLENGGVRIHYFLPYCEACVSELRRLPWILALQKAATEGNAACIEIECLVGGPYGIASALAWEGLTKRFGNILADRAAGAHTEVVRSPAGCNGITMCIMN
jgi:hypothetical protein